MENMSRVMIIIGVDTDRQFSYSSYVLVWIQAGRLGLYLFMLML
jgi:hypothetical protein